MRSRSAFLNAACASQILEKQTAKCSGAPVPVHSRHHRRLRGVGFKWNWRRCCIWFALLQMAINARDASVCASALAARSAPLGVRRGLACFSGLVAEERELLPFASMQRRDNQGGRLLMRTPARPRLPDGDCVFISGGWIVARANAPGIAADMALLGFAPRCILVHIAFSVSKL